MMIFYKKCFQKLQVRRKPEIVFQMCQRQQMIAMYANRFALLPAVKILMKDGVFFL